MNPLEHEACGKAATVSRKEREFHMESSGRPEKQEIDDKRAVENRIINSVKVCFLALVCLVVVVKGCEAFNSPAKSSSDAEDNLDKVVYGTVLKIDSAQGLSPLGFKQDLAEITLLEDCQVVGLFDTPPPNCSQSSGKSQVITLSIPKEKMYGPEIKVGDYIATRWSCKKSDPNSCVFAKYADAMSGDRQEGIHN